MAVVTRYVNPASTDGGNGTTNALTGANRAYVSLSDWEGHEQTDLDTANNIMKVICETDGTADTTQCVIETWTTSADDYITIEVASGSRHAGKYDTAKYRMEITNQLYGAIFVRVRYCRIDGMQIQATASGTGECKGIYTNYAESGAGETRVSNCVIKGVSSGTGSNAGIADGESDIALLVWNSVIYGFHSGDDPNFKGIDVTEPTTFTAYNCTVYGNEYGCYISAATTSVMKNCAVFGNEKDVDGSIDTYDYNAMDDNTYLGANGVDLNENASGEWTNNFTDYANGDFSLKSGGSCVGAGVDDPGSGLYSTDIAGNARSDWDIGAFEYVAAGGDPEGSLIGGKLIRGGLLMHGVLVRG